ncbi:MAG: hypothetical protein GX594_18100 [Pirellulaceae bacterium]|nr:hypothetical protein [Pirellulaceae bacterium]
MGKQKFRCVGTIRTSGKRVSAEIMAENEQDARRIAERNGVAVDSIAAATAAAVVAKPIEDDDPELLNRLDAIIRADGQELEGYLDDIGDDPTPPVEPAMKACPFCGERILAVAKKCKHCGTFLEEKSPAAGKSSKWLWISIGGAAVAALAVLLALLLMRDRTQEPTPPPPAPIASEPLEPQPAAPAAAPAVEKPEPTAAEIAFAEKLSVFLDGVDETAAMLEKAPTSEECTKQFNALKASFDALPEPPPDADWAVAAAASVGQMLELAQMLPFSLTTLEMAAEALHQKPGESPEIRGACRQAAEKIRQLAASIRKTIPPECLAKP